MSVALYGQLVTVRQEKSIAFLVIAEIVHLFILKADILTLILKRMEHPWLRFVGAIGTFFNVPFFSKVLKAVFLHSIICELRIRVVVTII